VIEESRIVTHRLNATLATQAVMTQLAIQSVLNKKGSKLFADQIKKLIEDGQ